MTISADATSKQKILDSALELYSDSPIRGTSVQEVVEHAGLTKGAFYHHFKSKAHLVAELHNSYVRQQMADVRRVVDAGTDPVLVLEDVLTLMFVEVVQNKASILLFEREFPDMPADLVTEVRAVRDAFEAQLVSVIQACRDRHLIESELNTRTISFGVVGMCAWASTWFHEDGEYPAEMVGRGLARMVIKGLAIRG